MKLAEKRHKEKELRWKQPYANAKIEDLFEVFNSIATENFYFRKFLVEKELFKEEEFNDFLIKNLTQVQSPTSNKETEITETPQEGELATV